MFRWQQCSVYGLLLPRFGLSPSSSFYLSIYLSLALSISLSNDRSLHLPPLSYVKLPLLTKPKRSLQYAKRSAPSLSRKKSRKSGWIFARKKTKQKAVKPRENFASVSITLSSVSSAEKCLLHPRTSGAHVSHESEGELRPSIYIVLAVITRCDAFTGTLNICVIQAERGK